MDKPQGFAQARIDDLIARAHRQTVFTPFIDPVSAAEIERICRSAGIPHSKWGGHENAERVIAAIGGGALDADFPLQPLEISWDARYANVGHHDILGAIMALGIKRETFGDILTSSQKAYVFALRHIAPAIAGLASAGRAHVSVRPCEAAEISPQAGSIITATFQSLRLDAVMASALRIARSQAARLISQGRVQLNFALCLKGDSKVAPGDIISVRGVGRIKLGQTGGMSKKDRIYLSMEVFKH